MKLKSLAIIGSRGMVGSDLVLYLKPKFENIAEIDKENYQEYAGQSFDVVINANGNSNKIWANKNAFEDFEISTVSVYKSLLDFPYKTYIYISSVDVYNDHTKAAKEETEISSEKLTPYGFHKFLSECIVKNHAKNFLILRCSMILGSNLKKGPVFDILQNSRLFVSANSSFQMITTKELANIINFLINKDVKKEVFNTGGKGTLALNKVVEYAKKTVKFPPNLPTQTYITDVSKLNKTFPLKTSEEYLKDFLKEYILRD